MTKTDTRDIVSTINQIKEIEKAGCQIVRCAIPDLDAAKALKKIIKGVDIPVVADIHFDYKLALESIKSGIHGLRINPGNIGSRNKIEMVMKSVKQAGIPIRIGVNSGSLEKDILKEYGSPTSDALVESAIRHISILDDLNFYDIKVSVKSSSVAIMQDGIGSLLSEGIGDTIRVSLTDHPVKEVVFAKTILKALGHFQNGIELISCPGCGRLEIDLESLVNDVEKKIVNLKPQRSLKVAILGCVVNGPGEASDADIGIAGGRGKGQIYKNGKLFKSCKENEIVDILVEEIKNLN
jgi:(E)-4-hydroxy-3-methylbut-2-enyl-diphosphate synthase